MATRFRAVLHRVLSESKMEPPKDDSRPLYPRPRYCIGVYLDALDARPDKSTQVGSHHAFMMAVMDKMLEYLRGLDLTKVKGLLEKRYIGDGVILEGFKHGCVLEVTFDNEASLTDFWMLHKKNRLTSLIQDAIVDKTLLKTVNAAKVTLRTKLWEDEYEACKNEILSRDTSRVALSSFKQDFEVVKRVRDYQRETPEVIGKARDAESIFEHHLGELMLNVKQILPQTTTVIKNVREFSTNMKVARGTQQKVSFTRIDHLLKSIELFRRIFEDVQREIVFPLCQVRALCENANQRNLKKTIKVACSEILNNLRPEADLQKIRHKEWESKVLQREQDLFYGLISLIPMAMDRLTTIDYSVDEYINDFPEMADP